MAYKYVVIVGLHLYALDCCLSQENMSLQVDFLLKPFEAYNRMYFRPRLLKQHFHFFAADSLSIMLPQTVYRWAVMNGFISKGIFRKNKKKEKKRKDRGVWAEIEKRNQKMWVYVWLNLMMGVPSVQFLFPKSRQIWERVASPVSSVPEIFTVL